MMQPSEAWHQYHLLKLEGADDKERTIRATAERLVALDKERNATDVLRVPWRTIKPKRGYQDLRTTLPSYTTPCYQDLRITLPSYMTGFAAQLVVEQQLREQLP